MKKFLPYCFLIFSIYCVIGLFSPSSVSAACNPPGDYSSCPELRPDLNLDILTYEPISGYLGLSDFWGGETDLNAPQFNTLIDNNPTPSIISLYQLHYWDWSTNSAGDFVPPPTNLPLDQYDFATLVGLSTQPGQAVLVPNSGYDIGGGYEAMVLFASPNSITLKYTREDNVFSGYTVYLKNFQVDPTLLAYYNELSTAGRTELPVLKAGMKIGEALGEILVAIRDTGSFMDPRWIRAWWQNLDPATLLALLLQSMAVETNPFASLVCDFQATGERDSRPNDCSPCNMTSSFCQACATSFTVQDTVTYERWEGDPEPPHCVEKDWSGKVTIDPTSTTIPFVGKKREEGNINAREDEQKYLADYFDGTHEYYRTYDVQVGIPFIGGKTAFHGTNTALLPNYQGVFRKLTPMEYQDVLKREMVERAESATPELHEGNIHHYEVSYKPRLCWNFSFFGDAAIEFARSIAGGMELDFGPIEADTSKLFSFLTSISHYCLYNFSGPIDDTKLNVAQEAIDVFNGTMSVLGPLGNLFKIQTEGKIDGVEKPLVDLAGNFPPEPDEEDYINKWREWKDSEWGKLWEAVPMVSREDTPGVIAPYLGYKSEDTPKAIPPEIEKVPHVARLYEVTQKVKNILLPLEGGVLSAHKEAGLILASAGQELLEEKTLLAQGGEVCTPDGGACASIEIRSISCAGGSCTVVIDGSGYGHAWVTINGQFMGINALGPGMFYTIGSPGPGGEACISVDVTNFDIGTPTGHLSVTASCCMTLDANGEGSCVGEPYKPPSTCGISGPQPVADCYATAIKDTNANDELCCGTIEIPLTAVDAFHNNQYLPCGTAGEYGCHWIEVTPGETELVCKDHCYDEITEEVNRRFGIWLRHPYLTDIWNQSTNSETMGIFNIFRPAQIPQFEDLDAASDISYIQTGFESIEPSTGEFYFNHLGGVQKAKEWVTTKVLMPYVEQ